MIELIALPGKHTTVATVHPVASVVLLAQQSHDSSMESASQATPPFVAEKDFVLVRFVFPPPCTPQVPVASFVQAAHASQVPQPQSTVRELKFNF